MGVGPRARPQQARCVKAVELVTSTPGFRTEIYASDSPEVPPDILDTRWAHLEDKSDVGTKERITLDTGTAKYRYVLVWLTRPPKAGPTVSLAKRACSADRVAAQRAT
jgi:hypothetical protein